MAIIVTRETGATAKNLPLTNQEVDNNFININTELGTKLNSSEKGVANGVAPLDANSKLPPANLPDISTINGQSLIGSGDVAVEPVIAPGTTSDYWRGDKTWRNFFADVRAATLTGFSTATNAVVVAADTVLAALGKLQAQITSLGTSKQDALVSGTNIKTINSTSLLGSGDLAINTGVTDHGALTGLADDDHPQYYNQARGDARYSQLGHTHAVADVTGLQTALDGKAASNHTHTASQISDSTAVGRSVLTAADAAAARTAIGAGTGDVTLTGTQTLTNKTITGLLETRVAIPASDINLANGNYFTRTISSTTTFTVSNVPASGTAATFILELTNGGSAIVNWFSGVKWAIGTAPTLTASGVDILGFYTHDGGATWRGMLLAKDSK